MTDCTAEPLVTRLQARREQLTTAWLSRTLLAYPEQSSPFLRQEPDPFRNPIGHAFATALPVLLDEVLGAMQAGRVTAALEPVVRIRAVQDLPPREGIRFVFLLKPVVREIAGEGDAIGADLAAVDARIDELALLAFDLYMRCRERIHEIRHADLRRSLAMQTARRGGAGGVSR